jgi:predicted nucleic acid-binding protein
MRVFLDTNIVLDFFLARHPFFAEAKQIFDHTANNKFHTFVSSITVINSFYTIRKEKGKAIAFQAVTDLLKIVEIANADKPILQKALSNNFTDYEDAVQNESAIAENLDAIVTRNTKDFKNSTLKIHTPSEFLQTI